LPKLLSADLTNFGGGAQPAAATFTDDRQQFVVNTSPSNTTEDLSGNSDTLLITGSGSIKNDCRQ
jgi:hypothetical protein